MVTDPETLDRIELLRDPNSGKFIGYDPDTGDTFPVPFDALSTGEIGNDGNDITLSDSLNLDSDAAPLIRASNVLIDITNKVSIDDTNRVEVSDESLATGGLLILINNTNNKVGIFRLGVNSDASIVDADSQFTVTKGNDGTTNVYYESGDNYVENQLGSTETFSWWMIGAGR
jgi:hypothetical protein